MPAVTRIGDADVTHCSGMTRAEGSPNVFAEFLPVGRVGDKVGPKCTSVMKGSPNVFANGGGGGVPNVGGGWGL